MNEGIKIWWVVLKGGQILSRVFLE
jgi:hypothetical protein